MLQSILETLVNRKLRSVDDQINKLSNIFKIQEYFRDNRSENKKDLDKANKDLIKIQKEVDKIDNMIYEVQNSMNYNQSELKDMITLIAKPSNYDH